MAVSEVTIGRLHLKNPVMNAAGPWAASIDQLKQLHASRSGAVVTKTFTLELAHGNPKPNYYFAKDHSINSVGLANEGAEYFVEFIKNIDKTKPIIASLFETTTARFLELALKVQNARFDAVELNLSCPNVTTKEPIAYDMQALDELLKCLLASITLPIGLKLPPFLTRGQIKEVAGVIASCPINHLVLINTYPLSTEYINHRQVIAPNNGIGGLGGRYLKPIALAHIVLFKEALPAVPIIGVGGIADREDVRDFIQAGAVAIQAGSLLQKDLDLIDRLI